MSRKAGAASARISGPMVWKRTAPHGTRCAAMFTSRGWRQGASRPKSCSSQSANKLAAVDVQDIAIRILEPSGLEISRNMDVAFATESGQVVVFEHDVRPLEGPDDGFDFVTDAPGRRCRLIGAGKLRLIDHDDGTSAAIGDHSGAFHAGRLETESAFIEFLSSCNVLHRNRGHCIFVCQHRNSPVCEVRAYEGLRIAQFRRTVALTAEARFRFKVR